MTFAKFLSDCCSICLSCCACFTICGHTAALKLFCPCIEHEGIDEDEEEDDDDVPIHERDQASGEYATTLPPYAPQMSLNMPAGR
ncbi:hypothetical protein DFH08DRAFT_1086929 [Mycena albidolilacea]|uniref:Secreted protein n=1 Tax=Mycena albidolilacea TaxID=1033008 RepID=A0AAD7EEH6_9AGAR|nr:hypothetical protein DFH08DRAFT_1086929 [Mycena albidolilacea]